MRVSYDTEFGGSSTSASAGFRQQTLKNSIYCSGTGLHSGAKVAMSLHPAEPDTGILFRRSDIAGETANIPARFDMVSDTRLCTTLSNEAGVSVSTVEHLMAALAGCGVDNAVVEINGPELPIMDGSSEPFVFLIDCAGVVAQGAPRRAIRVLKPVSIEDGASSARIEPWAGSSINIELDFETKVIGRQSLFIDMLSDSFRERLSRARTLHPSILGRFMSSVSAKGSSRSASSTAASPSDTVTGVKPASRTWAEI